jgi:hypothetical protein
LPLLFPVKSAYINTGNIFIGIKPMSQINPLQKFFRQPKVFISLPSKGLYYEPGALQGDYNNMPIFAMSGMDEIIMKTPDALFTGEASVKVIESCCPYIKNAKAMPSIDIDAVLIAIRIATFGEKMSISKSCTKCGTDNEYDIELNQFLDYFNSLKFTNAVQIFDNLVIRIRPLQYEEMSYFSIENFKLQKTLIQINDVPDQERQKKVDEIYANLSELQLQLFLTVIENVQVEGVLVTEKAHIEEWLRNTDRDSYKLIKEKLEENKNVWEMPPQKVHCASCGTENNVTVTMDQSSFFA